MFGQSQKRAKPAAGAATARLHSIAAVLRDRGFAGGFDVGGVNYNFTFFPAKASVTGNRLQLTGGLSVVDARANARPSSHSIPEVRAMLAAAQGGIGTPPPRKNTPADISPARADLPIVESTGSLSFCGVLYFKLAQVDGRTLGVPADMKQLQLNVRLAPVSDAERRLQAAFSSVVDALYGQQVDVNAAEAAVGELNRLLAGS